MSVEFLDLILSRFAKRNSLTLYKRDKENSPERLFRIAGNFSNAKTIAWNIWLSDGLGRDADEIWTGNKGIIVNLIKLGHLDTHQKFPATPETLNEILEKCLAIVKQGFADDGVEMSDDN